MKGIAAAPISWGVCEVPGWGVQLSCARVLGDARRLGLTATEAGPPGFLSADAYAARAQLEGFGLRLVGGFVTATLHVPARRAAELAEVERQAVWLSTVGADVLVLAAATGRDGYDIRTALDAEAWRELFASLREVQVLADRYGLALAVHPHFGTAIETAEDIDRLIAGCDTALCLDTGHAALGGADPARIAARIPERIAHVHLKDVDPVLGGRVRARTVPYAEGVRRGLFRPLGCGAAGIEDVIARLRAGGYGGWYVLEQDVALEPAHEAVDPASWVRESLEFVRARA